MNLNVIKVLILSLLLSFSMALSAQEEFDCNLPAPQSLTLTLLAPDVVDAMWSSVVGAYGYEIMLVDLSINQVLYTNTHLGNNATISGHTITSDMIVTVAALCDNGEPGNHVTGEPEGIHLEELVLQISGPNGGTVTHTCLKDKYGSFTQTVGAYNQPVISVQVTTQTNINPAGRTKFAKTFVELSGAPHITFNNQSAYSLVELSVNPFGGPLNPSFPNQLSSSGPVNNTFQNPTLTPNLVETLFGNPLSTVTKFYALDHNDPLALNTAGFYIESAHQDHIDITVRNCFEGRLSSENGGSEGLVADNTNQQDLTHNTLKTKTPGFTAGPNPVSDRLNITLQEKGTVTIMDINGKVWHQVNTQDLRLTVDMNNWPTGTYILRYDDGKTTHIQRVIKL